jgi:ATP-dependent Lon protease
LEKIKKRLIEYLAVLRLKEINAEKERLEVMRREQALKAKQLAEAQAAIASEEREQNPAAEEKALVPYKAPEVHIPTRQPSSSASRGVKGPILLYTLPFFTSKIF